MMMRRTMAEDAAAQRRETESAAARADQETLQAVGYFSADPAAGTAGLSEEQEAAFQDFCIRIGADAVTMLAAASDDPSVYRDLLEHVAALDGDVAVVAEALDVFGPRPEDAALAALEIERLGGRVEVLDQGIIDAKFLAMSVWPRVPGSASIGERIKKAMRNRAIRGEGLGKPPYGYRIGKNRKLEVHEEEAETVKLIYTLYTQQNLGIRLIVRHLNEAGIPTRKGGAWSLVTVRDILRNRAYLGTYSRFGLRVPGSHPPIVTPDMFRWAQATLDERKPKRGKSQSAPFLLSGMIYCGFCGQDDKRMVGVTRRQSWTRRKDGVKTEKQYHYYQCQARTNQSMCQYHTTRAQDLENDVLDKLRGQRGRIASLKGRRPAASAQALRKERQQIEAKLKTTERRIKQAAQAVGRDAASLAEFDRRTAELVDERLDALATLRQLDGGGRTPRDGATAGERAVKALDSLNDIWEDGSVEDKRRLLGQIVDRVTMDDDGVDVKLKLG